MVMLGLSSLNKIKTKQLLVNSKNLKLNNFNCEILLEGRFAKIEKK